MTIIGHHERARSDGYPTGRQADRPDWGVLAALLLVALAVPVTAAAEAPPSAEMINQRLYQALGSHASSGRIETVSGQLYLSKENIDASVIRDALDALLDGPQTKNETVAVRRARRLNFEIHFPKNSADLTDESRKGLDELGEALRSDHLKTRFVLGGHTDLDGDADVNGPLSQARADSARAYLIQRHGIKPARLDARGYGTSEPLRQVEKSEQDKRYNRRVDLRPMGR